MTLRLSRRPSDPATAFFWTALILCGVALTWTCAAFGLLVATTPHGGAVASPRTPFAQRRVQAVARGVEAYRGDWNECPRKRDQLVDDGYVDRRNFQDPWGERIVFGCAGDDVRVQSAGPDGCFGTPDDVKNER